MSDSRVVHVIVLTFVIETSVIVLIESVSHVLTDSASVVSISSVEMYVLMCTVVLETISRIILLLLTYLLQFGAYCGIPTLLNPLRFLFHLHVNDPLNCCGGFNLTSTVF